MSIGAQNSIGTQFVAHIRPPFHQLAINSCESKQARMQFGGRMEHNKYIYVHVQVAQKAN